MKIYSLEDILNDTSTPPVQLIGDGILPAKSLLLLTGAKKARKTFLAYNLGIALASGESFAGFKIGSPQKVLTLSAEGGYFSNRERIQKMCKEIEFVDKSYFNVCFDSRLKLDDIIDCNRIEEKIIEFFPDILIIDPFIKFHHLDENSAQDMGRVLEKIRNFIEDYDLSIILVHHLGKDQTLGARGSSAILGEYDSCITLSKDSDNKLKTKIDFDLRHANSPDSRKLTFNTESFWFEEDISPIVTHVKKTGPKTKKELVDYLVEQRLYKQAGAYKAIDREVTRGNLFLGNDQRYQTPLE